MYVRVEGLAGEVRCLLLRDVFEDKKGGKKRKTVGLKLVSKQPSIHTYSVVRFKSDQPINHIPLEKLI